MYWYLFLGGLAAWALARWYTYYKSWVNVPVVGGSGPIGSWIAAFRWTKNARGLVQEGYEKHGDFAFQVSTPQRWEVFICEEQMVKEYRNLMDDRMSANAVTADMFQTQFTTPGAAEGVYRMPIPILAKGLTWQRARAENRADSYFSEFVDEFIYAFEVEANIQGNGWNDLACFHTGTRIVAHLTAKSLVGRPLCRNPEVIDLFAEFGNAVPISGFFIAMFPEFLKPLAARLCSAPRISDRLNELVHSDIQRRRQEGRKEIKDICDYLCNWVEQNAPGKYDDWHVTRLVVASVFGAIHTTTQVLVHCLYDIATRKEYVAPLRAEIESVYKEQGGWTKSGIESLKKVDSFVKECQRYNALDAGSLARCATQDFLFSNGLKLPKGTFLFSPNTPILFDERNYVNPHEFDGYRFYKLAEQAANPSDYKFIATHSKYLQFGDGRHTCPGRYMAADEIRLMLAYILLHYDVAIKDDGPRPQNTFFKKILFPDMNANVVLKRRESQ